MISQWSRRGKIKVQASKLFADFWIWDNFLRSQHYTLDTLPLQSAYFKVERLLIDDTLYMCVFTRSQVHRNMAQEHIRSLFRKADRPEPVFVTMLKFRKMQNAVS